MDFDKGLDPAKIESRWYTHWVTLGVFTARAARARSLRWGQS